MHGSYGPVVRLWLGPSQLLVSVKDSRVIKELLTKAEDKLPLTGKTYNLACGKLGLFISSFEKVCVSNVIKYHMQSAVLICLVCLAYFL